MKNVRVCYRAASPSSQVFDDLTKSFKSEKNSVSIRQYGPPIVSPDLILKEAKDDGIDICVMVNENIEFTGDIDEVVDEFDELTGVVYADYEGRGLYAYLKAPPVLNMVTPLLFVGVDKIKTDNSIIEDIFSSNVSKHIPRSLSRVLNE